MSVPAYQPWHDNDRPAACPTTDQFPRIIEEAPIGIFQSTVAGRFLSANAALARILGYASPAELLREVTDIAAMLFHHPEQRTALLQRVIRSERFLREEVHYRRKDGATVITNLYMRAVRDAGGKVLFLEGYVEDITDRRQAEQAVAQSELKYRELVENANSIILRWSRDGVVTFLNEFGLQFFGYTEEEIFGRPVEGTIVPATETTGRDLTTLMQDIRADPRRYERNVNENMRRNGERAWISWTNKIVFDDRGEVKEILSVGTDITERRRAEEELRKYREHLEDLVQERTVELAEANERLRELDVLKSMFIASMSHELRTPLNSIIGFTGMTLQGLSGEINAEQRDNLTRVYQSSRHLLALITDVIDISKIEAGRIDVFVSSFSLRALVEEAVETIWPQAQEKGLPIAVELEDDAELQLDRKRLLQCLLNLLSNAVKFTESGDITVRAQTVNGELELAVVDTGIGIAEEDQPRLFEAFERLESRLRVKAGGTGLGLYLTKKIVTDIFRGRISVQSRAGVGSTFALHIPLKSELV